MTQSRVRVTWYDGTPDVDQVMPTADVHGFLVPIKAANVFFGNSGGGRLDRHVDGTLTLVGRVEVTDAKPAAGQQHITTEGN